MDAPIPCPQPASILIVDDECDIREALQFVFEGEGYSAVTEAATADDALAHLRANTRPHVVLLDFFIGPGSAETLLQAVQQDATLQRHQYILMPGSHVTRFSEHAQRLVSDVCVEIVYKPFDTTVLLDAVKRAAAQLPPGPSIASLQ